MPISENLFTRTIFYFSPGCIDSPSTLSLQQIIACNGIRAKLVLKDVPWKMNLLAFTNVLSAKAICN